MSEEIHRKRVSGLSASERDNLLVAALDALDWQEMAEADPESGRRKGYFDMARKRRREVLREAQAAEGP